MDEVDRRDSFEREQLASVMHDGVVRSSLPCCRCRYELKGLSKTGECPECAAPIAESVALRLLGTMSELTPDALGVQILGRGLLVILGLTLFVFAFFVFLLRQ